MRPKPPEPHIFQTARIAGHAPQTVAHCTACGLTVRTGVFFDLPACKPVEPRVAA